MPRIKMLDGNSVYVRVLGTGPTIVLLHGFGMQSLHWLPYIAPLLKRNRFIMPDFRGFGRSHLSPYNQACVLQNNAEDLHEILAELNVEQFKLAGISMGALVSLQYQKRFNSQNIEHYLHIDQSPKCINDQEWQWGLFGGQNSQRIERAKHLIKQLEPFIANQYNYYDLPLNLRQQLSHELGEFFASAFSRSSHKFIARKLCSNQRLFTRLLAVDNWPAYVHCLKSYLIHNYDMSDVFRAMTIPLSLIIGLKSEMYPCGGQLRIADYAEHSQIIPFSRSGHTPLIDQPLRFHQSLRRFANS